VGESGRRILPGRGKRNQRDEAGERKTGKGVGALNLKGNRVKISAGRS